METHSSAQICKMYGVPFIGLRVLSNTELHGESFNPEVTVAQKNTKKELSHEEISFVGKL